MRNYELTVLVKPGHSEKELDKLIKDLVALVDKAGGKIISKTDPVKKNLAYEIEKVKEAYYCFFELEILPEKILDLETELKLEPAIIRYLVVSKA